LYKLSIKRHDVRPYTKNLPIRYDGNRCRDVRADGVPLLAVGAKKSVFPPSACRIVIQQALVVPVDAPDGTDAVG
jgi:hypothetical protein